MKKIVKAHIGYSDGDFRRSITFDGSTLSWRNTLSPGRPPVPDYDSSEKKTVLGEIDVQLLVNLLGNRYLWLGNDDALSANRRGSCSSALYNAANQKDQS